jgi:DNA ligase (NAD+)
MKQNKVNTSLPITERFEFLKYCANLYESNGTSPISDFEYDTEYYALSNIDPNNDFFDEVGGIDGSHVYGTQMKHEVIMGSLNKSQNEDEFEEWFNNQYKSFNSSTSFLLQHKIDGLSLGLIYEDGSLKRAMTRGNGIIGVDVTNNAKEVSGVQKTIAYKGKVEIRGECFKDRADFYKNWHLSVRENGYKNPRNYSAGSLNQTDPSVTKERGLEFIAYEVVQKDFKYETDKQLFLIENGFTTLKDSTKITKTGLTGDLLKIAVKRYMESINRKDLPYDIDGAVFKPNDISVLKSMGYTNGGKKARASRAIKFPPEEKETILIGVQANVGRTGNIIPVGLLEPVELGGAIISKVTLHNFGSLVGNSKLKIGSTVVIAKKGDIIPQIVSVKDATGDLKDIEIPQSCPSCGEHLQWDSTKVNIYCDNINCLAQLNKKVEHWLKTLGVKGIGEGIIEKLTNKEALEWEGKAIIESLPEIYYMLDNDRRSIHPFRKYQYLKDNLGEKTYSNILKSIKSVNSATLDLFIQALGIGQVGRTAKDIVAIAPTVKDIDKLTVDDIIKLDGFAGKKADSFVKGWKSIRPEIETLIKYISIEEKKLNSEKLKGKKFCFTGSFSKPRKEMENIVVNNGGEASGSVGSGVTLVWDGAENGSKYKKAKDKNNEIISEDDFFKLI